MDYKLHSMTARRYVLRTVLRGLHRTNHRTDHGGEPLACAVALDWRGCGSYARFGDPYRRHDDTAPRSDGLNLSQLHRVGRLCGGSPTESLGLPNSNRANTPVVHN